MDPLTIKPGFRLNSHPAFSPERFSHPCAHLSLQTKDSLTLAGDSSSASQCSWQEASRPGGPAPSASQGGRGGLHCAAHSTALNSERCSISAQRETAIALHEERGRSRKREGELSLERGGLAGEGKRFCRHSTAMEEASKGASSAPAAPAELVAPTPPAEPTAAAAGPKRSTAPSTSFEGCRPALSQEILEVVKEMGFESMTPVQVCVS